MENLGSPALCDCKLIKVQIKYSLGKPFYVVKKFSHCLRGSWFDQLQLSFSSSNKKFLVVWTHSFYHASGEKKKLFCSGDGMGLFQSRVPTHLLCKSFVLRENYVRVYLFLYKWYLGWLFSQFSLVFATVHTTDVLWLHICCTMAHFGDLMSIISFLDSMKKNDMAKTGIIKGKCNFCHLNMKIEWSDNWKPFLGDEHF